MAHNAVGVEIPGSPSTKHHPLPPLQTSLSDLTQSSFADASDAVANLTPSSSSSIYSANESTSQTQSQSISPQKMHAQSHPDMAMQTLKPRPLESLKLRDAATTAADRENIPSTTPPRSPSTTSMMLDTPIQGGQGQKRSANGEMKSSASPVRFQTPRNDLAGTVGKHSRTMSTDSNPSRIAEVSAQLRAKLSYAAARVESQWQLRSPESKHDAARRSDSPASPALSHPGPKQSPYISTNGSKSSAHGRHQPSFSNDFAAARSAGISNTSSMSNGQNGDSYRAPATLDMSQIPKLAPPADIVARNGAAPRRRPNPNVANHDNPGTTFKSPYTHFRKPSLSHQSSSSSNHANFLIPDTPPPNSQHRSSQETPVAAADGPPKQRTPSQNALMEQDAIETLLFMSSPENSGYRKNSQQTTLPSNLASMASTAMSPPAQPGQSNLDSGLNGRRRRGVSFADDSSKKTIVPSSRTYNGTTPRAGAEQQAGDEIDRMLDAMDDSDSDMEDGWFARLPQQQPAMTNQGSGDDSSKTTCSSTQPNTPWSSFQS